MSMQPLLVGTVPNTLREAFGEALAELMRSRPEVVVVDGDVAGGTGTHHVRAAHPNRFFQIGIAEQNMMCVAAGLSACGLIPVVATFSVFILRAYEMARLAIACDNRNVKIVGSHPGLDAGPDGASAQCLEDLAAFLTLPNFTVVAPGDPLEVRLATRAILDYVGPVYMRTGRSPAPTIFDSSHQFTLGKGMILRDGSDITLIGCGIQTARCLEAAKLLESDGLSVRVVHMPTVKPLDVELILNCAEATQMIVTSEDHNALTGLGSQIARLLSSHRPTPVFCNGVQDTFGESGEPEELAEKYGISPTGIAADAQAFLKRMRR